MQTQLWQSCQQYNLVYYEELFMTEGIQWHLLAFCPYNLLRVFQCLTFLVCISIAFMFNYCILTVFSLKKWMYEWVSNTWSLKLSVAQIMTVIEWGCVVAAAADCHSRWYSTNGRWCNRSSNKQLTVVWWTDWSVCANSFYLFFVGFYRSTDLAWFSSLSSESLCVFTVLGLPGAIYI